MEKTQQTFGKYRLGKTLGKGYQAKVSSHLFFMCILTELGGVFLLSQGKIMLLA